MCFIPEHNIKFNKNCGLISFYLFSMFRDTFSSLMGHYDLTNHLAIAENESKARIKFNMLEKMLQPCGPPPEKKSED